MSERIALISGTGRFLEESVAALAGTVDRLLVAAPAAIAGGEWLSHDPAEPASWESLSAAVLDGYGPVDILVQAAPESVPRGDIRPTMIAPWFATREAVRLLKPDDKAALVIQCLAPSRGEPLRDAVLEASRLTMAAALIDLMAMDRHPRLNRLIIDDGADMSGFAASLRLLTDPRSSFMTGTELALDARPLGTGGDTLAGKTILVTGATSGIGRAIAIEAGRQGAWVGVGGRKRPLAEETLAEIRAAGGDGAVVPLDVTDAGQWAAAIDQIRTARGGLDGLVNNAGESRNRRFDQLTAGDIDFVLSINYEGALLGIEAARALMGDAGSIVTISSVAGVRGGPGAAAYSCSKAASIGLSRALSAAIETPGLRINALQPGFIWSDSVADALGEEGAAAFRAKIEPKTPLGRVGYPEEIAGPVCFLLSDAGAAIHGQAINVSGGLELAFP